MERLGKGRLILVSGGARSGKSKLAQDLALQMKGRMVTYLATGEARDEEMQERIMAHQRSRPATWETVEEPIHIVPVIRKTLQANRLLLLDCMTLWLSNLLLHDTQKTQEELTHEVLRELEEIITCQREEDGYVILVSNEVGMGIVPESPLGRIFRDVNGRLNTYLARVAHQVYISFFGISLELKHLERLQRE